MTPLMQALETASVNLDDFTPLGHSTTWGTRTFLSFNPEQGKGWEVVQLNIIQRIFRAVFGYYKTTKLEHVISCVRCERFRKSLLEKQQATIDQLASLLYKKWAFSKREAPVDWRRTHYQRYAALWNRADPSKPFPDYPANESARKPTKFYPITNILSYLLDW